MGKPRLDKRIEMILNLLPPDQVVLNAGCAGNPELHELLCNQSQAVMGIDIDERRLEALAERGFEVRCMNVERIDLPMTFDYIVAGQLTEHLSNVGSFIQSATACLRPGGRMIFSVPNIASMLLYGLVVICEKPQDPTHVCHFDRATLLALLGRYTDLQVESISFVPPTIKPFGRGLMRPLFLLATAAANLGFLVSKRLFGSYLVVVLRKMENGEKSAAEPGRGRVRCA